MATDDTDDDANWLWEHLSNDADRPDVAMEAAEDQAEQERLLAALKKLSPMEKQLLRLRGIDVELYT